MPRAKPQGEGLLYFWCPACNTAHGIRVAPAANPWEWNGSLDRPTFTPSVLARHPGDQKDGGTIPPLVCHSYVTDGRIQFLADCSHAMKGQTVDLPEWPYP